MAGAWQSQPLDLMSVFVAAQQANAQKQSLEMRKQDQEFERQQWDAQQRAAEAKQAWQERVAGLYGKAVGGDQGAMSALASTSPEAAEGAQGYISRQAKAESERALTTNQLIDEVVSSATAGGQFSPDALQAGVVAMGKAAMQGQIDPEVFQRFRGYASNPEADLESLAAEQQAARMEIMARTESEAPPQWKEALGQLHTELGQEIPWRPAVREHGPRLQAIQAALAQEAAKRGGTNVDVNIDMREPGLQKPTAAAATGIQERQIMVEGIDDWLDGIEPLVKPEYFGLQGDIREFANTKMSYLFGRVPEKMQAWQDNKQELRAFGTMLFYDILVAFSGKAVTNAERAYLEKAIGNPDSMSLTEYSAAVKAMRKVVKYSKDRYSRMGRPGGGLDWIQDQEVRAWTDEQVAKAEAELADKPEEFSAQLRAINNKAWSRVMGNEARSRIRQRGGSPAEPPMGEPTDAPRAASGDDAFLEEVARKTALAEGGDKEAMKWLEANVQ